VWASIPLHDLIMLVLLGWPFVLWAFAISVVIAAWIWLAVNVVYMIRAIAVLIRDHSRNRNQTGT